MKYILILVALCLFELSVCSPSWPTFLYYSSYGASPQTLSVTGSLKILLSYSPSKQTIFVVHGFDSSPSAAEIVAIRNALLKNTQSNVILVDWTGGADTFLDYDKASSDAILAGQYIAKFIQNNNIPLSNAYCVGHSLGAHACGSAGANLGGKLGRITGLDPAGPLFQENGQFYSKRLTKADAVFVDVIHTDPGLYGTSLPSGDLDFFVNYDGLFTMQPGCFILPSCNHHAACYYYASSTTCNFTAQLCSKVRLDNDQDFDGCSSLNTGVTSLMGYKANSAAQNGIYMLKTNKISC